MAALRIREAGGMLEGDIRLAIQNGNDQVRGEVQAIMKEHGEQLNKLADRLSYHLGGPVGDGQEKDIGEFGRFAEETRKRDEEQKLLLERLLRGQVEHAQKYQEREETRKLTEQALRGDIAGLRRDVDLVKAGQRGIVKRIGDLCKRMGPLLDFFTSNWGKAIWTVLTSSLALYTLKHIVISSKNTLFRWMPFLSPSR